MPITKILLYSCCLLILALPYIAYMLRGSISSYFAVLVFLLTAIWGLLRMRKPKEETVQLSKPLKTTSPLPPRSQQLANDIMTTFIGSMYDKARFLPDFDAKKEQENMVSRVTSTLRQHDLTLEDEAVEQLRTKFAEAVQRGLEDRKKA
ncbi:MAG: hypothetical protein ACERJ1_15350 [Halodesulfovibrio sp.]|uniref:hypothetical protein n=1 Tax=Halodesulfovibrio sp. TaxID=1912772 RepID=UPI00359DED23